MELRKAILSDFESLYSLRCEDTNIRWTGHHEAPVKENLEKCFLLNKSEFLEFKFFEWF